MSNLPKPLTKYGLASNSENFYFSPSSVLNFRKVTKFGRNWLKNKKLQAKKLRGGNTPLPPPPVLIGFITKGKEQHYVLIKDFSKFMYNQTKHKERKHFCMYCLQRFKSEIVLINHKENCITINGT